MRNKREKNEERVPRQYIPPTIRRGIQLTVLRGTGRQILFPRYFWLNLNYISRDESYSNRIKMADLSAHFTALDLKGIVEGLCVTREELRTGFSGGSENQRMVRGQYLEYPGFLETLIEFLEAQQWVIVTTDFFEGTAHWRDGNFHLIMNN